MDIIQVAQHAENLDRAVAFYEKLLGQPVTARFDPPGLAFFVVGNVRLLLDRLAPSALFYLLVDDVRETVESLRASGIEVTGEPQLIFTHTDDTLGPAGTDEWLAAIRDSEGNNVGLFSRERPESPA